ncbi:unnamed protein product [Penicillium palitans]
MLSTLPPELLRIICKFLDKGDLLKLCLLCRSTSSISSEALYRCLISERIPPLHRAIRCARLDVAARLLDKYQADINTYYACKTPLLLAIELRYSEAVEFILRYDLAIVERLLRFDSVNINHQSPDGASAIFHALEYGQFYMLQLLLSDSRTNVNVKNYSGQTPLHVAVQRGDYVAIQIMAKHSRTDVNCVDQNGDTPLLLAVKGFNRGGSIQNVFSLLLSRDLNINHPDSNGRTALWHAMKHTETSLVALLLRQNKLTLNDVDRWGFTPLARGAENESENESALPVKLLLRQPGININACSSDAVSPLWAACRAGRYDVVTLLLGRSSIDISQKGPTGTTPLQVATINGHSLIVSALLRHMS